MGKKQEVKKLYAFLALWDEEIGPKIIDMHPDKLTPDFEEISDQIFMSFQTIFGTSASVKFERTNLVLPLKTHKCIAKIALDAFKNKSVRGGRQPFIAVILTPESFPEDRLDVFNESIDLMVENYTNDKEISLSEYYGELLYSTERLGRDMNSAGSLFFKQKKYEKACDYHEIAVNLMEIAENGTGVETFTTDLNKSRLKYANDLISEGNKLKSELIYAEAERKYVQSLVLAKRAFDDSLASKVLKIMRSFYGLWAKTFEKEGEIALGERDYKKAHKALSQAVKLARTGQNHKAVKKIEKKLNRVPAVEIPQKEKCPYCGKEFMQLSRHKCKKAPQT